MKITWWNWIFVPFWLSIVAAAKIFGWWDESIATEKPDLDFNFVGRKKLKIPKIRGKMVYESIGIYELWYSRDCIDEAEEMSNGIIDLIHLLLALVGRSKSICQLLDKFDIRISELEKVMKEFNMKRKKYVSNLPNVCTGELWHVLRKAAEKCRQLPFTLITYELLLRTMLEIESTISRYFFAKLGEKMADFQDDLDAIVIERHANPVKQEQVV